MTWHVVTIRFTGALPTPEQLGRLNASLAVLDRDAPELTRRGVEDFEWRRPALSVEQVMGLLHREGFPCAGWSLTDCQHARGARPLEVTSGGAVRLDGHSLWLWEQEMRRPEDPYEPVIINGQQHPSAEDARAEKRAYGEEEEKHYDDVDYE